MREKVVAKWSERLVYDLPLVRPAVSLTSQHSIIADWQKYSPVLGTGVKPFSCLFIA